jgi:cellulose synthase/poly-beta-1,6-N-acetylglucosamine synthase-like glycosyltransferase/peptidoglycan/xylan/chitin deacetylase (PgdA/CDA1 family)
MLVSLLLAGYARHSTHASSTASTGKSAPVAGNGPIIDRSHNGLTSHSLPPQTVALTFDDGPDPTWTPRILAILRKEQVPATFFVTGARVESHPELVRQEIAQGNEIGSHTFTNVDVTGVSRMRADLELTANQLALSGSASVTTSLLRLPHTSIPEALTMRQRPMIERATQAGYTVILADRDSQDWRRPGVDAITRNAVPAAGGNGVIVEFHDGGGDRAQTITALPRVIRALKEQGYRFATVSAGLGLGATQGMRPVGTVEHLQGLTFGWAIDAAGFIAAALGWLLLLLAILALARTVLLFVFARRHATAVRRRAPDNGWIPMVSVIVPAYNEAVGIAATVRSVALGDYPYVEVIVVDDGSTDGTAEIVQGLGLANVSVIRQRNAGKAVALNTGLGAARYDVIVMVDADTIFAPNTIRRLVQPLRDERIGAVSGNTKVGNRRRLLGRWQHIEYVIGFNLDRRLYDVLHCMPTVPGAVGAYSRAALQRVGGVGIDTLAEDTDLTMTINQAGWQVVYEERAVAWTEAPVSLGALWRQRYRWSYGTLQAVWKHRAAFGRRGPGWQLGRIGLPYLLGFQFLLPLLAPVIDLYAAYGLVFLNPVRAAAYWLGFLALQIVTGIFALRLDHERMRPLWTIPLQQLVYRQLMYLVVVQSLLSALSGARLRWNRPERHGMAAGKPARVGAPQ